MKMRDFIESIEKTYPKNSVLIIDGENHVLGRVASIVAKLLLRGYRVYIVNSEKIVLSGPRRRVVEGYKLLLEVRTHKNPYKGPKRPRNPINLVKRAIRGMLPKESDKGFRAYKRLKVFIGVPEELKDKPMIRIPFAEASKLKGPYVYISEVAKELGWSTGE